MSTLSLPVPGVFYTRIQIAIKNKLSAPVSEQSRPSYSSPLRIPNHEPRQPCPNPASGHTAPVILPQRCIFHLSLGIGLVLVPGPGPCHAEVCMLLRRHPAASFGTAFPCEYSNTGATRRKLQPVLPFRVVLSLSGRSRRAEFVHVHPGELEPMLQDPGNEPCRAIPRDLANLMR